MKKYLLLIQLIMCYSQLQAQVENNDIAQVKMETTYHCRAWCEGYYSDDNPWYKGGSNDYHFFEVISSSSNDIKSATDNLKFKCTKQSILNGMNLNSISDFWSSIRSDTISGRSVWPSLTTDEGNKIAFDNLVYSVCRKFATIRLQSTEYQFFMPRDRMTRPGGGCVGIDSDICNDKYNSAKENALKEANKKCDSKDAKVISIERLPLTQGGDDERLLIFQRQELDSLRAVMYTGVKVTYECSKLQGISTQEALMGSF